MRQPSCERIPAQRLAQVRAALLVAAVGFLPSLLIPLALTREEHSPLAPFLILWLVPIAAAVGRRATLVCPDALVIRTLARARRLPWSHIRAAQLRKVRGSDGSLTGWLDLDVLVGDRRDRERWIRIAEVPPWLNRDGASPLATPRHWQREVSILAAVTRALAAHDVTLESTTEDLESPLHAIVVPLARALLASRSSIDIGRHAIVAAIWSRDAARIEGTQ